MAAWLRCSVGRPCNRGRCPASGAGRQDGLSRRRRHGAWCCARLWCGRYHEPRPPFSSACAAVDLDATAVDEQPVGRILGAGQRAENPFPDTALGSTDEAVVERLLRPVDIRTVGPASATAQRMDDPAQHPAIIDTLLAVHIGRQQRCNPLPLPIGKPKEIRHLTASQPEAMNHNSRIIGIRLLRPDPSNVPLHLPI